MATGKDRQISGKDAYHFILQMLAMNQQAVAAINISKADPGIQGVIIVLGIQRVLIKVKQDMALPGNIPANHPGNITEQRQAKVKACRKIPF